MIDAEKDHPMLTMPEAEKCILMLAVGQDGEFTENDAITVCRWAESVLREGTLEQRRMLQAVLTGRDALRVRDGGVDFRELPPEIERCWR